MFMGIQDLCAPQGKTSTYIISLTNPVTGKQISPLIMQPEKETDNKKSPQIIFRPREQRMPPSKAELKEQKEMEEEARLAKLRKKRIRLPKTKQEKPWPHFAGGLKTFSWKRRSKGK
ncbi:MAG TPA: hypothetical protein VK041_09050 [Opitutales bacterium]|nr:hypothetical protein [Opitutales bacterium]